MEILIALAFFAALLTAGFLLAGRKSRPKPNPEDPNHVPKLPEGYDGSKGWFGFGRKGE
jgi:hypothetical protein